MREAFDAYIAHGKTLAATRGLEWDFPLDDAGFSKQGWNLTQAISGAPPIHYLRDFGLDKKCLPALNAERSSIGLPDLGERVISEAWIDLLKAVACEQLFFRRTTPGHVVINVIRPLRILASCAGGIEPWNIDLDLIRLAYKLALASQPSGKLADNMLGVIKNTIDSNHLSNCCPLYPSLSIQRLSSLGVSKPNYTKKKKELLDSLESRKAAEKLPERRAFWELVRILLTEKPATYVDTLRFAALKVMLFCGLRIGEAVMLPADWKRTREYYDADGRLAGESGGFSRSTLLRHFAEKQQEASGNGVVLYENTQYIPEIFEEILTETLDEVVKITQPLRETLKLQIETGRILPRYAPEQLVSVIELYPVLSGNPFWLSIPDSTVTEFIKRYRENFDPSVLNELGAYQAKEYASFFGANSLDTAIYVYFNRILRNTKNASKPLVIRKRNGAPYYGERVMWSNAYLRISEVEEFLRETAPSKLPDTHTQKLSDGVFHAWEHLFLLPKRSLAEERNNGICDVTNYFAVGVPETALLSLSLGEQGKLKTTIFERYGQTDEDKKLTLRSHSLRHLQNTELFRLGVADAIITKRYNRRSVAQSYEYDHRSLAESLEQVEIPAEIELELGDKATTVAKLIKAGRATGPFVEKFKAIQKGQGDEAAFQFLSVEADGFHATPYGHCINSFTVDPCPKNLECFAGCGHLMATNLPSNRHHLERLEQKFEAALSTVTARPASTIGRENQIAHASIRLESVRKLLNTPAGEKVFPNGPDFSKPTTSRSLFDE